MKEWKISLSYRIGSSNTPRSKQTESLPTKTTIHSIQLYDMLPQFLWCFIGIFDYSNTTSGPPKAHHSFHPSIRCSTNISTLTHDFQKQPWIIRSYNHHYHQTIIKTATSTNNKFLRGREKYTNSRCRIDETSSVVQKQRTKIVNFSIYSSSKQIITDPQVDNK